MSALICVLLCCVPCLLNAQSLSGPIQGCESNCDSLTVKIFFQVGKSAYNEALGDNRAVLADYISRVKQLNDRGLIEEIVVKGYVSPEGPTALNERLAVRRSQVLADIITQRAGVDRDKIKTIAEGIDWDELRRQIEARPDAPGRATLLNIIDNTPIWIFNKQGKIIGGRKKSLMDLRGGRTYRWLNDNVFPQMRSAAAISLSIIPVCPEQTEAPGGVAVADVDTLAQAPAVETIISTENTAEVLPQPISDNLGVEVADIDPLHMLALKTNLLYYPILLPNLELEWYVNDKWSVAVEGNIAWWGKYSRNRSYRLKMGSAEVRYWFHQRALRRGFYAGVTAGYGEYDFLKDTPGYLGEGIMGGITGGYQWPISRNLSLEAELGLGYMHTKVKKYIPFEGHHVYQSTKEINYFGPIKLEFSLVWRFLDKNKSSKNSRR